MEKVNSIGSYKMVGHWISIISLKLFCLLQFLWVLVIGLIAYDQILPYMDLSPAKIILAFCLVLYFTSSIGIFFNLRWAWIVSIVFLALNCFFQGTLFLVIFVSNCIHQGLIESVVGELNALVLHFKLLFTLHEIKPIVGAAVILATILKLPAICLLILAILSRSHIIRILLNESIPSSLKSEY